MAVLDVGHEIESVPLAIQLRAISKESGLGALKIATAYARLALGRGKVSFQDFVNLRLFDPAFHENANLNAYVGQRRNLDICVAVNYRHDWHGILSNKLATSGYLSAYGLPVVPATAVYDSHLTTGGPRVLNNLAALRTFLSNPGSYPLFGKPLEGFQSLGSIALRSCVASDGELEKTDGTRILLADLAADIQTHYSDGYVFQPLLRPDPKIAALCGDRLACLRIITALAEDGPQVLRVALKIPAGGHSADNYWRPGNLLAQVDRQTGVIRKVTSGSGFDTQHHLQHPDTGAALVGFAYPRWESMLSLALEGARVMQHVPLIGWDIASTDCGPKIVEMNATPDFFLAQFADRKGILDRAFRSFMDFQGRKALAHRKYMKSTIRKL
jgi:Sugar-transfer associated ATP-grasp